jgi:hypothetical protein
MTVSFPMRWNGGCRVVRDEERAACCLVIPIPLTWSTRCITRKTELWRESAIAAAVGDIHDGWLVGKRVHSTT